MQVVVPTPAGACQLGFNEYNQLATFDEGNCSLATKQTHPKGMSSQGQKAFVKLSRVSISYLPRETG